MRKNLIAQTCNGGIGELFKRIRDFICARNGSYDYSTTGIGWTLHDSFYATNQDSCALNDWFVVKSTGETGSRDLYYRIKWVAATQLIVEGYLYWNNSSHTGILLFSNTNNINASTSTLITWIYGDLDHFLISTKVSSVYCGQYSGGLEKTWGDQSTAISTTALTTGSGKTITLNSLPASPDWAVGKKVFIWDNGNVELITITYVDNILNEIKANLVYSYSINAKLCKNLNNFLTGNTSFTTPTLSYDRLLIGKNGVITNSVARYATCGAPPTFVTKNPDVQNNEYGVYPVTIYSGTSSTDFGYCGCLIDVRYISSTNLVSEDIVTDNTNNWRVFNFSGSQGTLIIKEV